MDLSVEDLIVRFDRYASFDAERAILIKVSAAVGCEPRGLCFAVPDRRTNEFTIESGRKNPPI